MGCQLTQTLYQNCIKNPDAATRIVLFEKFKTNIVYWGKGPCDDDWDDNYAHSLVTVYVIESDIKPWPEFVKNF